MRQIDRYKRGFTLIELSIVLVIIGLIVGGVLVGQDLIKEAAIKSVISDTQKFQTAANTFRTKYNCLPGDCLNATDFFGTDSNGCPTGGGATGTCNGDGNGQVGLFQFTGLLLPQETFRFWQQLGMAGMVSGNFTGVAGAGGTRDTTLGVNVPTSKIQGAGYTIEYLSSDGLLPNSSLRWIANGHYLFFGTEVEVFSGQTIYETDGVILTSLEAYSIDAKMDDGLPGTGSVMTVDSNTPLCAAPVNSTGAQYSTTSSTGPQCSLEFRMNF